MTIAMLLKNTVIAASALINNNILKK
jgi:5,10-methylene-tetrahydrofolate dehydrogenase/methenyl tetrahydrofolate cyclohydrolase